MAIKIKTIVLGLALALATQGALARYQADTITNLSPAELKQLKQELHQWKVSPVGQDAVKRGFMPHQRAAANNARARALEEEVGSPDAEDRLDEELKRFLQAKQEVATLQKEQPRAQFSVNTPFALLTDDEFKAWVDRANTAGSQRHDTQANTKVYVENKNKRNGPKQAARPTQIDWQQKGCVTRVKDQGDCGSCWVFGAIAALESGYCVHGDKHKLIELSEQEVGSCSEPKTMCNGGYDGTAYDWIIEHNSGGVCTEATAPYTSGEWESDCHNVTLHDSFFGGSGSGSFEYEYCSWHYSEPTCPHDNKSFKCNKVDLGLVAYAGGRFPDHTDLEQVVAQQPVEALLHGSSSAFRFYESGVLMGDEVKCPAEWTNHIVEIVGYGEQDGVKYWRAKNSYGTLWGDKGYFRIERGYQGATHGACGIEGWAYYPIFRSQMPNLAQRQCNQPKPGVRIEGKALEDVLVHNNTACCNACRRTAGCQAAVFKTDKIPRPSGATVGSSWSGDSSYYGGSSSGSYSWDDDYWTEVLPDEWAELVHANWTCHLLASIEREVVDGDYTSLTMTTTELVDPKQKPTHKPKPTQKQQQQQKQKQQQTTPAKK